MAALVGVCPRTVGNWETGRARCPYAAYKLLRVFLHGELPDPRWSAFRLLRGKLVTPEGHEIALSDLGWLSLLVRRAEAFSELLAQRAAGAWPGAAGRQAGEVGEASAAEGPAEAGAAAAGAAVALGLVYSSTSDTRGAESGASAGAPGQLAGQLVAPARPPAGGFAASRDPAGLGGAKPSPSDKRPAGVAA